jgi:hypothetical protein
VYVYVWRTFLLIKPPPREGQNFSLLPGMFINHGEVFAFVTPSFIFLILLLLFCFVFDE